jgi:hypothetical protein
MGRFLNRKKKKRFAFAREYETLQEIAMDEDLANLGDAYTNLVYSIYISQRENKPRGAKISSLILSKALRRVGLRKLMPSRMDRHKQGDAVEALLVYVWLLGLTTITEDVDMLAKHDDVVEAFSFLLNGVKRKLDSF